MGRPKGGIPWNKGIKLPYPVWNKGLKNTQIPWNKGIKGAQIAWNKNTKGIMIAWNKGKKGTGFALHPENIAIMKGSQNAAWKGGVTPQNQKIRTSKKYATWRKAVFERDNYTCQKCGERGGELNADHIKPFSLFPELRLTIDNGRTLCEGCHKQTETYGRKAYRHPVI